MKSPLRFFLSVLTIFACFLSLGADWLQFRGPDGKGVSSDTGLPTSWSETENVVWKTKLPGLGTSSPIVLGDRIYLTCYTGYGLAGDTTGDKDDLMVHVVCLKRDGGELLWRREFKPPTPEADYSGNNSKHGYSSSTPTTDGKRLYVFFGKLGVFALKLEDGETIWTANVGSGEHGWGSSNSPVLFEDLLLINASIESTAVVALNKETGQEVWRTDGVVKSWSTPALVETPEGATEVVVSAEGSLFGYDPKTGEKLWECDGIDDYICPTPVTHNGIIYATAGRTTETIAVQAGGRGDVTDTHEVWRIRPGAKVPSPVYHDGFLYLIHDRGTATCVNAETGEEIFSERLPDTGTIYASPTLADGKIFVLTQHNGAIVLAAKPEFEVLASNKTADDQRINASPVVHNSQLLIRSDAYLYCIGQK